MRTWLMQIERWVRDGERDARLYSLSVDAQMCDPFLSRRL